MKMDQLDGMMAFVKVARRKSFTRAGEELQVSASAISQAITQLEQRLGARLFDRTTRSVQLTEAGHAFLRRVEPAVDELLGATGALAEFSDQPRGTLRINVGKVACRMLLQPHLPAFLAAYPEIRVELCMGDELVDIVADGFDCGIRLGESLQADMVALRFGPDLRTTIVGSPRYFRRNPPPRTLEDLARHNCINLRFDQDGTLYRWELEKKGRDVSIEVHGTLTVNDPFLALDHARDGVGLAYAFDLTAGEDLARGRLVSVLESFCPRYPGFFLYYPNRKQVPAKLRAFIDFMKGRL